MAASGLAEPGLPPAQEASPLSLACGRPRKLTDVISPRATSKVGLSTTSVYPESTASAFEVASVLGYDGVEIMVGVDPISTDVDAIAKLRDYHQVPVLAIHAPCLLISQRTWGTDSWAKLERSVAAAQRLDAEVVVVHPPFRWQREYAEGFVDGVRRLNESSPVKVAVENMYPWRAPGGGDFKAYLPTWDPSMLDLDYLTLDLSHASTSRRRSLDYLRDWGERLTHVHLTDGSGSLKDEHLFPGQGDQNADLVLQELALAGFGGHVVAEVNCRRSGSRAQREADLAATLAFARRHLGQLVA